MTDLTPFERYTELIETIKILTDIHIAYRGDPFLYSTVVIDDDIYKIFSYVHPVIQTSTREYVCGNTIIKEYGVAIQQKNHVYAAYVDMNIYEQLHIDMYHHAKRILAIFIDIYTRRLICETLLVKYN